MTQPIESRLATLAAALDAYREALDSGDFRRAMNELHVIVRNATASYEICDRLARVKP